MLRATKAVRSLKQYHPPLGSREGLRLDFNENTVGCSPRVLVRLRSLTEADLTRYPERAPAEKLIGGWLGLGSNQVLLTNGVDEAIHLIAETYLEPGTEALIPVPTFSLYEIYAAATGARVVTVPSGEDFRFPLEQLLAGITPATRLIAIANPNNPTGAVVDRKSLLRIAEAAPQAAVLVDEAYFDFYGQSVIGDIARFPNLLVARTFSKAYGMAGMRIGLLAGAAEQISMVRRVASPYSVNGVALACLPDAIADAAYIDLYVSVVRHNRTRVEAELDALGLKYWKSEANFVLARFGDAHAAFVAAMRDCGVLVRDRNSDPDCAGCVRITIGTNEQTDVLITALRAVVPRLRMEVSA